jgi:1,2-diacylglycerol 3-alpha-glucosyltransferase
MNILLFTTSYFPEYNGASLRVEGLCKGISQLGHRLVVIAPGKTFRKDIHRYSTVYYIPVPKNKIFFYLESFTKFNLSRYRAFKKYLPMILQQERIDVIHTRQPLDFFSLGARIKKRLGLRWITEAHKLLSQTDYENKQLSYPVYKIVSWFEKHFINKSDGVVALTKTGAGYLSTMGIVVPTIYVENSFHTILPKPKLSDMKHKTLVYVGNIRETEGLDTLLAAFKEILFHYPDVRLCLVGGGKRYSLECKAKALGIMHRVSFIGEVTHDKALDYLSHAYLFVFPRKNVTYHHNIIGLKIYDALAAHLPIITGNIGELADFIQYHKVGLLSRIDDPHDFAKQVIKVLEDSKLYMKMRKNIVKVQKKHTWKKNCKSLAKLYRGCDS